MTTSKKSNALKVWRQGDVWIYRIETRTLPAHDGLPIKPVEGLGLVLAEGEVTGHHHRIPTLDAQLFQTTNVGMRLLKVPKGGATVVHEEHDTLELPEGNYEVRIQREYTPTERSKQSYVRD